MLHVEERRSEWTSSRDFFDESGKGEEANDKFAGGSNCCTILIRRSCTEPIGIPNRAPREAICLVANSVAGTIDPHINYTLQYRQVYQVLYDWTHNLQEGSGSRGLY
jgi:peptide/nickel transport system substrate-binding protein